MSSDSADIRVLVVAADPLARAGLATLLSDQPGWIIAGQSSGEADIPVELETYRPHVVVWDLGWGPSAALEPLADLAAYGPPVVALLAGDTRAVDAWTAGARGILFRDTDIKSLVAALGAVVQGLTVLDPRLAGDVLPARDRAPDKLVEELTPRELEVLRLLAEGLPNKSIAQSLGISEHTVKFHVNAILGKLDARSRTEAVTRATRLGLILL